MRFILFLILLFFILLIPSTDLNADWKAEIAKRHLNERYKITKVNNHVVKLTNKIYGTTRYVDVSDKKVSIAKMSDEMQVFDLPSIPDSLFKSKYTYQAKLLVGGALGTPLSIGDFNHNGKLDFAGMYKVIQDHELGQVGIVEQQSDTIFTLEKLFNYADSATMCIGVTDVDKDGKIELNNRRAQEFYNYEAVSPDSLPGKFNFSHRMWQISGMVSSETFTDMDNDGIIDVIYVGDDTLDPWGSKMYVAEYKQAVNNFVQVFRFPPPCWRVSGISVGDFDGDGFKEFATGSIHGDVYVVENTGDDQYKYIFSDTIATPNAYLTCATNDMDFNGKPEFFIGGSSYYYGISGTRVYWYEADGDNNYKKICSFFLVGTGVLGTTELYSYDVNADGIDDLVFAFEHYVVILTWNNSTNQFDLYYLKYINLGYSEIQSVNIYDLNNDKKPDLLITVSDYLNEPRNFTDYYKNTTIAGIKPKAVQDIRLCSMYSYPNPFNNSTRIQFSLQKQEAISLSIYDLTGKEVVRLIDNQIFQPGLYYVFWNGKNKNGKEVSSGVYFYQLKSNNFSQTKKMLLMR